MRSATTAFGDSRWVRCRLGSAGPSRAGLIARLREHLPAADREGKLALTAAQLERVLPGREARLLAGATSGVRGDPERLRRIAWWGTALAGLPGTATGTARVEAGRFNLAFALFDSVVDDTPRRVAPLAGALAPDRLRARLAEPDRAADVLSSELRELEPLIRLFDTALTATGRRLRGQPSRLDQLGDLLAAMFWSELRVTPDPFLAKTLPVVFIGSLVDRHPSTARLFRALARFLWLWDDWLDLAADLRRLRPNAFLGAGGSSAARTTACARGAARLVAGSRAHGRIADRLEYALASTLDAARLAGDGTYRRTVAFHRELIG